MKEVPSESYERDAFLPYARMLELPLYPLSDNVDLDDHMVAAHQQFLAGFEEEWKEIASKSPTIVTQLFPNVQRWEAKTAMASWFSYLHVVTNIVKKMEVPLAIQELVESWMIFNQQSKYCTEDVTDSGFTVLNNIRSYSEALRVHLQLLLPSAMVAKVCLQICQVIIGTIEEILFREAHSCDLEHYLKIRCKTVGLGPYFAMIGIKAVRIPVTEEDYLMECLKASVKDAVSYQNDLARLKSDLVNAETLNYVIISRSQTSAKNTSSLRLELNDYFIDIMRTIRQHNETHRWAAECYQRLKNSERCRLQSRALYYLIATHWRLVGT